MKKYMYITITVILLLFLSLGCYYYTAYNNLEKKYYITKNNEKAYLLNQDSLQSNIRALTLTIDQLEYAQDSILSELNKTRRNLKIKDKQIQSLQNIKTEVIKTDTLILTDTIFKQEEFKLDTLLGDKWCSLNLNLQYPNIIEYDVKYTNDLNVVVYTEKETIDPPKKCWLGRLFQKKHLVTKVNVQDNNPYSTIKDQTFIIINN